MNAVAAFLDRIKWRLRWSWAGLVATWGEQPSFRQWTWVNAASVVAALALPLTGGERAVILALGVLILAAELFNTAIEYTVDYISTDRHPLAGRAKDAASAGVFLTAVAGGVAWLAVAWRLLTVT